MSLINTEIKPFTATAFHNGEFVDVTDADLDGQVVGRLLLPGRLHLRLPDRARRPRRQLRRVPAPRRRDLLGVDRHALHATRRGTTLRHDRQDPVPDGRRPDRRRSPRNFDVLREGQGLADRGTFVIDPDGVIQLVEITAEGIGRNAVELLRKIKAAQYVARAPERGLPGQVGRGRRHPRPVARPRRQDLTDPRRAGLRSAAAAAAPDGATRRRALADAPIDPPAPPTRLEHRHARRRPDRAAEDPPREDHPADRAGRLARRRPQVAPSSRELLDEIAALSDQITVAPRRRRRAPPVVRHRPRVGTDVAVRFAGIPLGHEFTSLVLALLQVGGHPSTASRRGCSSRSQDLEGDYALRDLLLAVAARTAPTWCRRST